MELEILGKRKFVGVLLNMGNHRKGTDVSWSKLLRVGVSFVANVQISAIKKYQISNLEVLLLSILVVVEFHSVVGLNQPLHEGGSVLRSSVAHTTFSVHCRGKRQRDYGTTGPCMHV